MKLNVPRFDGHTVLVAGDVMLDRYWHGESLRISPEAPVPVVKVDAREDRPGGAANVALNVVALGADYDVSTTPGVVLGVNEFYSVPGAAHMAQLLPDFRGCFLDFSQTSVQHIRKLCTLTQHF